MGRTRTNNDEILTLKEACIVLKVSEATLYKWLRERNETGIPAHKVQGQWRFFKTELSDWVEQQ